VILATVNHIQRNAECRDEPAPVLAYNFKRSMTLLGNARVMDAIKAYALFLSLKRLLRAFTLLTLSEVPKKIRSVHNAFWDFQICLCR
jgi:hypothetical protein